MIPGSFWSWLPATLRPGDSDELMEIVLSPLGKRLGPDDAGVELEILEHPQVSLLEQADADIQPTGIGPVMRIWGAGATDSLG